MTKTSVQPLFFSRSRVAFLASILPSVALAALPEKFCQQEGLASEDAVDLVHKDAFLSPPWTVNETQTLQGSGVVQPGRMCANATALQACFQESLRRGLGDAPRLKAWLEAKGLDPLAVLLAFSAQETRLGTALTRATTDAAAGVGLLGVREWNAGRVGYSEQAGTYNALAGLRGGLLALDAAAARLSPADSLADLARQYAKSRPPAEREAYAQSVVHHATRTLSSCDGALWKAPTEDDATSQGATLFSPGAVEQNLLPLDPFADVAERFVLFPPRGLKDVQFRTLSGKRWSAPVSVREGEHACVSPAGEGLTHVLVSGDQNGKTLYQQIPVGRVDGTSAIPKCAVSTKGTGLSADVSGQENNPQLNAAPASAPLVQNVKNGSAVLNGFSLSFARGLDDISVALLLEGEKKEALVEGATPRDTFCYAESRGAPTRTLKLRVEARTPELQRVYQDLSLIFTPGEWRESGPCPKTQGATLVAPTEVPQPLLLKSPLNGQSLPNGVVFLPKEGVSDLRISSVFNGRTYVVVDKIPAHHAACYTFTHPGSRTLEITGKVKGTPVKQTLKLAIGSRLGPDKRCPQKPGGLLFVPSLGEIDPKTPPTPLDPDESPDETPRDPRKGIVVMMPVPGSTVPNGVPFQFTRGLKNVRLWLEVGGKRWELTTSPLEANSQGLCYRFEETGIRRLVATATDAQGNTITHTLSYDVTNKQTSINWCTDPSVTGGKIFDPRVPQQDILSVDEQDKAARANIVAAALAAVGTSFRAGETAQSAEFVRSVLTRTCNERFSSSHRRVIQAKNPYDADILGNTADLSPASPNSLAGIEIGRMVKNVSDLQPADLVFKSNTYGSWANGVITHVGIYVGNGMFVDRPTNGDVIVKRPLGAVSGAFASGTRLYTSWCNGNSKPILMD